MIAKFSDSGNQILEVESHEDGISFFIYQFQEEQVGQSITLPLSEVNNLIKYLQSLQLFQ